MSDIESWLLLGVSIFFIVVGSVFFVASRSSSRGSPLPLWVNQWILPGTVWGGGVFELLILRRSGFMGKTGITFTIIVILIIAGSVLFMIIGSRRNLLSFMMQPSSPPASGHVQLTGLTLDPDVEREIQVLLSQRKKIEAIKRVKQATGMGLKEAKDYVESLIPKKNI